MLTSHVAALLCALTTSSESVITMHMSKSGWPRLLLPLCTLWAACGPLPEMVMPSTLEASGDVYRVHGADGALLPALATQHVDFGPYQMRAGAGISKDTHTQATLLNGGEERWSSSQSGWFTLRTPSSYWRSQCVRDVHGQSEHQESLEIGSHGALVQDQAGPSREARTLRCLIQSGDKTLRFSLDLERGGAAAGSLTGEGLALRLRPTFEQRHQPFGGGTLAGYVVEDEHGPVGAVDIGPQRRVAFSRSLSAGERDLVANACAGVILLRFLD